MNLAEYSSFDGLGLAALVHRGEISAQELRQVGLAAIRVANPALNAVIEIYERSEATPRVIGSGAPFAGVPFLLKDIGSHDADVLFELGSRLCSGLKAPPHASELVKRFRASGISILGRTNIPELGTGCTTEPISYGATRNPWNLQHSPGGSSGGAAAAVASGIVPIAHANDAGGSIRVPAAWCGLVGLKPSRNLNPIGPDEALAVNGLAAEHIVSRTVRDTAAMLDVTAGTDIGAWCYTPRHQGSYLEAIGRPPRPLRIAINLHANFPPAPLANDAIEAVRSTARLCEALGHIVEEDALKFDAEPVMHAISVLNICGLRSAVDNLSKVTGRVPSVDTLEPHTLAALRDSERYSGADVIDALAQFNAVARAYGKFFQSYDVMLTPTCAAEAPALGRIPAIRTERFHDWFWEMASFAPFTATANIAGIPAISLPAGFGDTNLPLGAQFLAALGQELVLLQLAAQLEQARPWTHLRPYHHVSTLAAPTA